MKSEHQKDVDKRLVIALFCSAIGAFLTGFTKNNYLSCIAIVCYLVALVLGVVVLVEALKKKRKHD